MSHILHLGHQPTDIPNTASNLSTLAGFFDPALDSNGLRFEGNWLFSQPFTLAFPEPAGDIWLGFRYRTPSGSANAPWTAARFLEVHDAQFSLLARIQPVTPGGQYRAIAEGDSPVQGASTFVPGNSAVHWIDLRVAVGASITIDFHVDGILHSTATAPNTGGKGKPRSIIFGNTQLHSQSSTFNWGYAHIAVLDGVSTIGRRFVRRSPNAIASFNQMNGSVAALADGDIATRVASTAPGQRMSFTLSGPTGPAAVSAIAGVHIKQIVQAGTDGPDATAGFLRIGGVNHDAPPVTVPSLAPKPVWSSWAVNPEDASPWDASTLPIEVGILSA